MRAVALATMALAALALGACGSDNGGSGGSGGSSAGSENAEIAPWGGVINTDGTPKRGGTLTVDQSSAPVGVSAVSMIERPENATMQVVAQVYDRLVEYLPGDLDPQPGLAERWEISDDGLTYTFHLRDAQFSNGMPVTAADVKYSLDYVRGPKALLPESYLVISEVLAPDDRTVVVQLSRPSPALIYAFGSIVASILPARVVRQMGKQAYAARPIGSGPFMVKRWVQDQVIELERNPNYWRRGLPYLDGVTFRATPNDNTRVLNITAGETDVADPVPFAQIEAIDAGGEANVLVAPGADMFVIFFNGGKKPFDELAVRQALNYATPTESISEIVFGGVAPIMNTVYPRGKYWNADAPRYDYEPERARELLARSSVPDGFSTTLTVTGEDQASGQVAQIVEEAWSKIGVRVTIQRVDAATLGTGWQTARNELTLFPPGAITTDQPVDDVMAALLFDSDTTSNLFTFHRDEGARRLVREAMASQDEAERRRLFGELQVRTIKDPPVIPLVYTPNRAAVRKDVHDFNYLLGGFWRLDTVWKD